MTRSRSQATSIALVIVPVAVPVLCRRTRWLRVVSRTAVAVSMGLSMAHALERPGKLELSVQRWWETTGLYRPWFGRAGHLEGTALLALPALAAVSTAGRPAALAAWTACLVANPGVFLTMVAPTNRATLRHPEEPPPDADRLRRRWELGHLLRFCCHALAFLLIAPDPAPRR